MGAHYHIQLWGNFASTLAIIGSLFGYIPAIAGAVALIWYIIQIAESDTLKRFKTARRERRIAELKAKLAKLEAKD